MNDATKCKLSTLFWGPMKNADMSRRVVALVFTTVSIAALSFCQLAFFPIGEVAGDTVYVILTIAPLMMGAILFGPAMAAVLGLYSGAVVFAHAYVFPLDFYELYYFTSFYTTFVMFTCLGALAGCAFHFIRTRTSAAGVKTVLICLVCLALSTAMSITIATIVVSETGGLEHLDVTKKYLYISQTGIAVQALIDALAASIFCLVADAVARQAVHSAKKRRLPLVFQHWMILISAIVFMIASSAIFSLETINDQVRADESMRDEAIYLASQLNSSENDGGLAVDPSRLLAGYSVELDGHTVITDKAGTILATNDPSGWPVGGSYEQITGYLNEDLMNDPELAGLDDTCLVLEQLSRSHETRSLQVPGADGQMSTDPLTTFAAAYDTGYVALMRDPAMIYATRIGTMTAATILAALLIIAIAVLANVLLRNMVVRHINDTNSSLEKITYGDLNERVKTQDTVEFDSLSSGINTTVVALKETIEEVEQRNAQDLATAKAIQEDALPTEFPAFPSIDAFDIYASMKTAKEVGGDFYDFFEIENTTKIGFVMADVSGKGIPAALFMMAAKTQLRNHMQAGLSVDAAVNAANHQLCLGNDAGMFVTALVCLLDYETGHVEYINAGHNPPLACRGTAWDWKKEVSGMPLGLFDGIPYDKIVFDLSKEDTFYLYTDGVTEAMNVNDELFGEERLKQTLGQYIGMNPRSICVGVRRAITDFTQDAEQSDDITMLALKYGVRPEEKAMMILDAKRDQLVHVVNYIHAELHRRHAPKSVYSQLGIACEELFVNVCSYAYPDATAENPGIVRIQFEYSPAPPTLTVQLSDDGIPYNPLAKKDAATVDEYDSIMDIPIGGLGILMAKKNVDEMTYERVDGTSNVLTFKKSW